MKVLESMGGVALAVGFILASHIAVSAQTPSGLAVSPVSDAALTAPVRNIYGRVKAVSGQRLTLASGGRDMTFAVDENTRVLASRGEGATRNEGGRLPITRLVRSGDMARVGYREVNGAMRVLEIQRGARRALASR